ncbi:hypothetical protein BPO_1309 [Bergeyella porcorum]|uniref:Uncharacterized protein n=1 Tax=Bergeyella porcorum TaxID=1735111 RepID=A0AAU0F7I6_9FLAO
MLKASQKVEKQPVANIEILHNLLKELNQN